MTKNMICLIVWMLISFGCSQVSSKEEVFKVKTTAWDDKKEIPVDICYVLCDFSASLDSHTMELVQSNLIKIYRTAALRCKLLIYDINTPQFGASFFQFNELMKNANKRSERNKLLKKAEAEMDTLNSRVLKKLKLNSSKNTCIIRTIDIIARSLALLPLHEKQQRIHIIVLSDMLEDCNWRNLNINLDGGKIDQEKRKIADLSKPDFTFLQYKNLKITLTACSQRQNINADGLSKFWKQLLQKYDYNLTTPLICELPDWVN